MAQGDWDESKHQRDASGKFTSGGPATRLARKATRFATRVYRRLVNARPKSDAPAEEHAEHAKGLRGAAEANVGAARAHNEAAEEASKDGNHELAQEHADAAKAHANEARSINREADEHAAIAGADKAEHAEAHDEIAGAAHKEAEKANEQHDKSQVDAEKNKHGKKDDEGEHEGGGEEPGSRGEKGGLAEWVKGKLEGAREGLSEKREALQEAEEQALEGDVYKGGAALGEQALRGMAGRAIYHATGGIARTALEKAIKARGEKEGEGGEGEGEREGGEKKKREKEKKKEKRGGEKRSEERE